MKIECAYYRTSYKKIFVDIKKLHLIKIEDSMTFI